MVATGLGTNILFPALVASLMATSVQSGRVALGAAKQLIETGSFEGNVVLVALSGLFSAFSLLVLAQGVLLAPPPPPKEE